MSSVKTLLVSQWFTPEPVHVPLSMARALRAQGESVAVLTAVPNYPDGVVANGYNGWRPSNEIIDGFQVHRTPVYPSHDGSAVKRMLTYATWAMSSAVLGVRRLQAADVALVYSSPATAALGPAIWSRIVRTPFVLVIQDLWPDSVTSSQFIRARAATRAIEWLLRGFVSWTYARAAHVVVISPGMVNVLAGRGVPRDKITLVYNWSSDADASDPLADRNGSRRRLGIAEDAFVVTYAGNQGAAQGLHTVLEAALKLNGTSSVSFVLAGDGTEARALAELKTKMALDNVTFLGRLSPEEMPHLQAASDVQLVSLVQDDLFAVTMPSKVQSILAAGKPLIVMAPGDAAEVVRTAGSGWAVRPGDPDDLARAILHAQTRTADELSAMGEAGREYYLRHMSRDVGGPRLDSILRRAAVYRRTGTVTNGEIRG